MSISSGVVTDFKVNNDLLQACDVGELTTTELLITRLIHQTTRFHEPIKKAKPTRFSNFEKTKTPYVNEARHHIFCGNSSCDETLPPNHDALQLHTERYNYQVAVPFNKLPRPQPSGLQLGSVGWPSYCVLDDNWSGTQCIAEYVQSSTDHVSRCESSRCTFRTSDLSCTELCSCIDCINHSICQCRCG